jgi:hypothetical protein
MRQSDAVWFHPAEVDSWTAGSISHSSKTAIIGVRSSATTPGFAMLFLVYYNLFCLLSFAFYLDAYSRRIWPIPSWIACHAQARRTVPGGSMTVGTTRRNR